MTTGLAGSLQLRPGRLPPAGITSTRQVALARVCIGMGAAEVPVRMPRLYALCGGAHELAARLALAAAARQDPVEAAPVQRDQLRRQTLREHLRRMWLDWPQQLAGRMPRPQALASLRELWQGGGTDPAAVARWVGDHVLGMTPQAWLAGAEAACGDWLADWMAGAAQEPARLLAGCAVLGLPALPQLPSLEAVQDDDAVLAGLGRRLLTDAGFAARPRLVLGDAVSPAHTGCWPRLQRLAGRARPHTALARLGATVEDVARLAVGEDILRARALPLGHGAAVAAVAMSRGVLLHALRVDADGRVAGYHVAAPTEWNFHPGGAVAQALARLDGDDPQAPRLARVLAAAFDPCVSFEVAADGRGPRSPNSRETHHA